MFHTEEETKKLVLSILKTKLAIYKVDNKTPVVNDFINKKSEFLSITRTMDELSVVCDENLITENISDYTKGWRAFKVDNGPLDFSLVGILSAILNLLAEAGISVFTISTYNTDYILIKEENLMKASEVLKEKYIIKN